MVINLIKIRWGIYIKIIIVIIKLIKIGKVSQ